MTDRGSDRRVRSVEQSLTRRARRMWTGPARRFNGAASRPRDMWAPTGMVAAVMVSLLSLLSIGVTGCETTVTQASGGRPLPPDPKQPPPALTNVPPNAMAVMLVGPKPMDTNGNGFPDLITVEAYLFAEPYPTPMWADGAFVFELYPLGMAGQPESKPIATWRIEGDALLASRTQSLAGRSYRLNLSLLERGTDVLPVSAVDLTSAFVPAGGAPVVRALGVRTVQMLPLSGG